MAFPPPPAQPCFRGDVEAEYDDGGQGDQAKSEPDHGIVAHRSSFVEGVGVPVKNFATDHEAGREQQPRGEGADECAKRQTPDRINN